LANDLGNLVSRLTSMIKKYCGGRMPAIADPSEIDNALLEDIEELVEILPEYLERPAVHAYLERVMQTVAETNRYVTDQAPWTLFKEGNTDRVATILAVSSRMVTVVAQLLSPVMPEKMAELLACFKLKTTSELNTDPLVEGTEISPAKALFPQLEAEEPPEPEQEAPKVDLPGLKSEISFDDFKKLDLRIAKVIACEPVPKTDKLLKVLVDMGFEKRQIVAGVAKHYKPEDLVGRRIVVVANLAAIKLCGVESQGMLLAAHSDKDLMILSPAGEAIPGSQVS
jgi:methionyl-tRNA synthetase